MIPRVFDYFRPSPQLPSTAVESMVAVQLPTVACPTQQGLKQRTRVDGSAPSPGRGSGKGRGERSLRLVVPLESGTENLRESALPTLGSSDRKPQMTGLALSDRVSTLHFDLAVTAEATDITGPSRTFTIVIIDVRSPQLADRGTVWRRFKMRTNRPVKRSPQKRRSPGRSGRPACDGFRPRTTGRTGATKTARFHG